MPWFREDGTATSTRPSYATASEYVSWETLARLCGNPSWAHDAEHAVKAYYREKAQQQILRAFNQRRAAA